MGLGITIGTGTPPIPNLELTGSASQVVVEERLGMPTRFSIALPIDIERSDLPALADGSYGPGATIMIAGPGGLDCMVHGFVHGHRIALVTGGEGSSLEIVGSDMSLKMDRETKIKNWPNPTDGEAVMAILAQNQFIPDANPTPARHLITQNTLMQRASDYAFIRMLAKRNGFIFWVSSTVIGIDTAHFKPPPVSGAASTSLSIKDADSALSRLDISWDIERPTSAEAHGLDVSNKSVLTGVAPQTPLAPLGSMPLSAIASETRKAVPTVAANDTGGLSARAEAALVEDGFFITAKCQTTPEAAGGLVRAHTLVEVDGAGTLHSGNYLVGGVTHRIGPDAHLMDLTLYRNAWG
ncbi:phage late control D family protein [Hoeflea sp.]|uniref:phage late control D family protein n=1 Tax=Hoeflea sp. TaxID=1940281 RepID=UPI003B023EC4